MPSEAEILIDDAAKKYCARGFSLPVLIMTQSKNHIA